MYRFVEQCLSDFVNDYKTIETHDDSWKEIDGAYIDNDVLKDMNKHIKRTYTTIYTYKGSRITLSLGYITKKKCGPYTYDVLLRFVNFLIHMFDRIKGHIPSVINVMIVDYYKKKTIPSKGELISRYVNSGLTVYDSSYVCVYRREEVIKVLIHEFIHLFNIDYKYGATNTRIDDMFCRNSINLNESFTDGLACYLNCILCSIVNRTDFKKNMQKEINHIIKMAAKVYQYYNIQRTCSHHTTEQTNTVAYYIVKGMLFYNFTGFKRYLADNRSMLQDLQEFKQLLIQSYTDDYRQLMLSQTAKDRSLRMSLISLKSKGI